MGLIKGWSERQHPKFEKELNQSAVYCHCVWLLKISFTTLLKPLSLILYHTLPFDTNSENNNFLRFFQEKFHFIKGVGVI